MRIAIPIKCIVSHLQPARLIEAIALKIEEVNISENSIYFNKIT
jgi:hypothetical protein